MALESRYLAVGVKELERLRESGSYYGFLMFRPEYPLLVSNVPADKRKTDFKRLAVVAERIGFSAEGGGYMKLEKGVPPRLALEKYEPTVLTVSPDGFKQALAVGMIIAEDVSFAEVGQK